MRYSKSSVLTIALTVACSAAEFSTVANAQNSNQDFPWRSKKSTVAAVEVAKPSLATPTRDLTTSEVIATPTPSFDTMPSVIYDDGKKYVRRGDTYVESPDDTGTSQVHENYATAASNSAQMQADKKSSFFQKTKQLTSRLNPFAQSSRRQSAYHSGDWKVPSFSQSLPSFSKKDNDPITFAAVTPLPAKTSVPTSLDSVPTLVASKSSYKSPTIKLPTRDSQFKSALPTETKLTSVFSAKKEVGSEKDSKPKVSTVAHLAKSKVSSRFNKNSAKDFKPEVASVAKSSSFSIATDLPKSFPAKSKNSSDVNDLSKGFTFTQQIAKTVSAPTKTKSTSKTSKFSIEPKARSTVSKSAAEITRKVSQDFSPLAEVSSEIRREVSKVGSKVTKPVRTAAHELSADHEFWSPRR